MTATQPQELQIINYAYESLISTDGEGEERPWLAESWEIGDDGASVVFQLKDGVTFHDGTPFNADAVIWNLDRYFKNDSPQFEPQGAGISRARAPLVGERGPAAGGDHRLLGRSVC